MNSREAQERKHEITVAITILIGIAVIIFAIFAVGNEHSILEDRYQLRVYMKRVNGLQTGAPVRVI